MIPKQSHEDDIRVGANLRKIRNARNVSQEKLAEALGVTFQQVQKYEKGSNRVSASRLVQITKALQCRLEDLFTGTGDSSGADVALHTPSAQATKVSVEFDRIKSSAIRARILSLVRVLAGGDEGETDRAA
jgi:transcriptional regulator with XRE-family HTH domain